MGKCRIMHMKMDEAHVFIIWKWASVNVIFFHKADIAT